MAIETNELIDVKTLSPFKKFIMTIGNLPTSYLESMTYAELLMWFCNYLQETVIPTVNNNADAVEELQNLYVELKEYVDNYLTEENLQPMIDNKLDEMAEDGTLQTILENYAQPILADLSQEVQQATDTVNNLIEDVDTIIEELREKYYDKYHFFELPSAMSNSWFKNIQIYESLDKRNYKYYINEESLKNTGGSTIYVDNTYSGDDSDGSQSKPYKTLYHAFRNTSDGDTIRVKKSIYFREELPTSNSEAKNNVNIICDEGTVFNCASRLSWSQNGTYSNVYQATRSGAVNVIDVRNRDEGIFTKLEQVTSVEACSNKLGSYYTDNATVYVNIGEVVNNQKVNVNLQLGYMGLNFESTSKNMHIYLENATCLNGSMPICRAASTSSYTCEFIAKNCKFLFMENSDARDGLSLLGAKSVLIGCEASMNGKDGFNYHETNDKKCYGIEVDCVGNFNGYGRGNHTFNGSTAHDGCQVIRMNGSYCGNNGSNIADVQTDTLTVNINCNGFDSSSNTSDVYDNDFCTQQAGATMYLYNCVAKGDSYKNLYCISGSTMYISNCKYDTITGSGTIINLDS